ncbi:protein FAM177A1 [Esox lucius]|uniref:Family with sequence similarity 177 member A1 n=1 Tax=Esox lucius TaxID=8010 RepID=A0A3P8XL73_ESOLU|nr:protein FAM177A1 [Esox lucius]
MAELSLFVTNVNISLGQTMDTEKSSSMVKEFECVELGDMGMKKQKVPKRTIYFASGETMEEYSTDEEDDEEVQASIAVKTSTDPSKLTWGPYFWFHMWRMATSTISVCDYLGERMASLFGITSPKYQYAIDEYYRMKKEEEEEEEENRLSEEAERRFEEHSQKVKQPATDQPECKASLELDPDATPDANRLPALVPT